MTVTNHPNRMRWTRETYVTLFFHLKREFGPWSDWEYRVGPGRNLDLKFKDFCVAFTRVVGSATPDAVGNVVLEAVLYPTGHDRFSGIGALRAHAAALDAGFLRDGDNGMSKPQSPYHTSFNRLQA